MSKVKVKDMYVYQGNDAEALGQYATGVVLELEDGRILALTSTDVLVPYVEVKDREESDESTNI